MQRRPFILAGAGAALLFIVRPAFAHHGWSSFDQARPIYLEGRVTKVAWQNPHAEIDLELKSDLKLPADLASRSLPSQTSPVDGPGLLKAAVLPTRKDKRWHVELAPLTRMQSWSVVPLKVGDEVSLIGFTFTGEKGDAVLRAEYLFSGGKVAGLRSSPA